VRVLALILLAAAGAAPPPPGVTGPRETVSQRPVFRFRSSGAVGFRCAFDSPRLHRCSVRYSERLAVGAHVLRVRAVGRSGAASRVVTVAVRVLERLSVGAAVAVGPGAGAPAAFGGAVWVPTTGDGSLVRVAGGAVVSRTPVGVAPPTGGFLDSAVASAGAVWAASDAGARISRVDADSGAVAATIPVAERPGGLTEGAGAVWAFHFLQGTVTRIDAAAMTSATLTLPGARATGIAFGAGSLWLLTTAPARLLRVDPVTGALQGTVPLSPPFAPRRAFIDSWWLAFRDGVVWATLPNHDAVARVDAATGEARYVRILHGRPFGVAAGGGSAWVATDRAVVRLDEATGSVVAAADLPLADRSGFVSIAYGDGAAWLTNYDRGTVVRVTP